VNPFYESRWKRIADRIFLIPTQQEEYILYAPLANYAALINAPAAYQIQKTIISKGKIKVPQSLEILLDNLSWLDESANAIIPVEHSSKFQPTSVTLFPTTRCNLQCVYCYADALQGQDGLRMNDEIGFSAIQYVSANAEKMELNSVGIGFHGGGEPLIERRFIERILSKAQMICTPRGQKLHLTAATNASLGPDTMQWAGETFDALTISCDGPEFIHDVHRPFHNGLGSWKIIDRNLRMLKNSKAKIGIRSTLSDYSAPHAADIVSFFAQSWGIKVIQFELLTQKGRGRDCRLQPPNDETFLKVFIDAYETGKQLGVKVDYSGTRIGGPHCNFCQVDGQSFSVTSDGYVTACFEVTGAQKAGAETFLYGKYNTNTHQFDFDHKKIRKLRVLTVNEKSACSKCFCKWNCAGDCPAKSPEVLRNGTDAYRTSTSGRCYINRAITAYLIKEKLKSGSEISKKPSQEINPKKIEEAQYETYL
jgi:uncharacterized protein